MTKRQAPSDSPTAHGFRRLAVVAKIGKSGLVQNIEATAEECRRIADFLGLPEISRLAAAISLNRWRDTGIRVSGKLKADVTQSCVVTLEPVPARIEAEFERCFLPADAPESVAESELEVFVALDAEDPPEPLGREIDLGEIVVEELVLNLDPYPRKAGAALAGAEEPESRQPSPFAALAKLKPPGKPSK